MKKLKLTKLLFIAILLCWLGSAFAHTSLKSSMPEANAQLTEAPKELSLNFGKAVRLMGLSVKSASGEEIKLDFKPSAKENTNFTVALPVLRADQYDVVWSILGDDGHKMKGEFSFGINAASEPAKQTKLPKKEIEKIFLGLDHPAAKAVIAFHEALKSGDEKRARAQLADDVLIFEGGGVERSADEYANHHLKADITYLKTMTVTPLEHQVKVFGDIAVSLARKNTKGIRKEKEVDKDGMETIVLNKIKGQWRIVHIHWS